jgi:hypothetical protein
MLANPASISHLTHDLWKIRANDYVNGRFEMNPRDWSPLHFRLLQLEGVNDFQFHGLTCRGIRPLEHIGFRLGYQDGGTG